MKSVDDLLYLLKEEMQALSSKKTSNLYYGYGCGTCIDKDIKKASILKDSLSRIKNSLIFSGTFCLDDLSIQKIVEKTNKFVTRKHCPAKRKDITIDDSNLNKYLLSSPQCVSFDAWNEFSRSICGKLGIKVTAVSSADEDRKKCDITFQISREIITCDLLFAFSIRKELCELGYTISRTDEECKLDWELLLEKNPSCDLDLKTFARITRKHNVNFDIFNEVYKSGLSLKESEDNLVVCTPLGQYNVQELSPERLDALLREGFIVSLNRYDIIKDYQR